MEIFVSIMVGIMGAGATLIAALIQNRRTNLQSALEMPSLNKILTIVIEDPVQEGQVEISRSTPDACQSLTVQARIAFREDLGCDPLPNEMLLFHRKARFCFLIAQCWGDGRPRRPSSKRHAAPSSDIDNEKGDDIRQGADQNVSRQECDDGIAIVTDKRVICKLSSSIQLHGCKSFWSSSVIRVPAENIKAARIRIQDNLVVLLEPTGAKEIKEFGSGRRYTASVIQVFISLKLGFFEPRLARTNTLLALIRSISPDRRLNRAETM